jgi:hypothetical protein
MVTHPPRLATLLGAPSIRRLLMLIHADPADATSGHQALDGVAALDLQLAGRSLVTGTRLQALFDRFLGDADRDRLVQFLSWEWNRSPKGVLTHRATHPLRPVSIRFDDPAAAILLAQAASGVELRVQGAGRWLAAVLRCGRVDEPIAAGAAILQERRAARSACSSFLSWWAERRHEPSPWNTPWPADADLEAAGLLLHAIIRAEGPESPAVRLRKSLRKAQKDRPGALALIG